MGKLFNLNVHNINENIRNERKIAGKIMVVPTKLILSLQKINYEIKVTVIQEMSNEDRWLTLRELAARTDCSYGKVFNIVHEQLNMRRISARWIP